MIRPSRHGQGPAAPRYTDGGQIAYEITRLTVAAEEVIAALLELVRDLVADVTRVGG
jgi:hypothetical protein